MDKQIPDNMPPLKNQNGYVLLLVIILLAVLMIGSVQFMMRNTASMKITGTSKDSMESLLLAESAMNILHGKFSFGADINNDNIPDNQFPIDLTQSPPTFKVSYLYYINDGNDISRTSPSLLQTIANTEARGSSAGSYNHAVPANSNVRISSLFKNSARPLVFIQSRNAISQTNQTWDGVEFGSKKAAAWLEVVRDSVRPNTLLIYVQAVGQVGLAKSYVQRYAGEYNQALGPRVATLTESNPNPGQ